MIPQCKNASVQSIRREVDLAWLAGALDGEGNFSFGIKQAQNGKYYFSPKIRIANTDVRMIRKIAEIYHAHNLVFFYTINKRRRYNLKWKDQLHIEIASQGTAAKLLKLIIPYLANKKNTAQIMLNIIEYVRLQPKGGNTSSVNYIAHPRFQECMKELDAEKSFYIDPSETTRRASTVCAW